MASVVDARAEVARGLRARRPELVRAIFVRVHNGALRPLGIEGAEYATGLRAAVAAAVEYGLDSIERGEHAVGPIPTAVLEQARRAARDDVSLDMVLRRYVMGHSLLGEFVLEQGDCWEQASNRYATRDALREQTAALNRLVAAVSAEYVNERRCAASTADEVPPALPAIVSKPSAYRARECLLFLAGHQGSSNWVIARAIGVAHQSQISRLLSELAHEGLACKRRQGPGRQNEWRLTTRGEALVKALDAPCTGSEVNLLHC